MVVCPENNQYSICGVGKVVWGRDGGYGSNYSSAIVSILGGGLIPITEDPDPDPLGTVRLPVVAVAWLECCCRGGRH